MTFPSDMAKMAESWIDIDDEPEIVSANIEDDILELEQQQSAQDDLDDDEPEPMEEEPTPEELMTFVEMEEAIRKVSPSATR